MEFKDDSSKKSQERETLVSLNLISIRMKR